MSRYVDVEWLKLVLELHRGVDLSDAPSIGIVRCRECKYNPKGIGWVSCPMTGTNTRKPDDFCSYGERTKGEDDE